RTGPKPRHLGRAGRRRRGPGDQLSLLRASVSPGPALQLSVLRLPRNLSARVARPRDPRGLAAVPGVSRARHRASHVVSGAGRPAAHGAHPLRTSHDDRRTLRSRRRAGVAGDTAVSWAVWITGPPGSGKSVLARAVAAELDAHLERPVVLELDEIRKVLTPSPTYSDIERDLVYRALVSMAAQLTAIGRPVIIDATAHRRAWRDLARRSIAHFAEVQLVCPLEMCREREARRVGGHAPRGIYARAGHQGARVPGVNVPYETTFDAELTIDTSRGALALSASRVAGVGGRPVAPRARAAPGEPPARDG